MPINAPPDAAREQWRRAEEVVDAAQTKEGQLEALEERHRPDDDRGRFVAEPPPATAPAGPAARLRAAAAARHAPPSADEKARRTAARLEKTPSQRSTPTAKAKEAAVPARRRAARPATATTNADVPPRPPPPRAAPTAPNPCDLGIPAWRQAKADGDSQFRANNVVAARGRYTAAPIASGYGRCADATRRSFRAALLSNRAACDMAMARHGAGKARVCYHRAIRDCTAA